MTAVLPCVECFARPQFDEHLCKLCWDEMAARSHEPKLEERCWYCGVERWSNDTAPFVCGKGGCPLGGDL